MASALDSPDGVRVAIQHDGAEVVRGQPADHRRLAGVHGSDHANRSPPVTTSTSASGRSNDGANDEVDWSPTITYTAIDGVADADVATLPTDVNGLSQTTYVAADDFILSGRPDTLVFMPYQGVVQFSATIDKQATTRRRQGRAHCTTAALARPSRTTLATLSAASVGQTSVSHDSRRRRARPPPTDTTPGSQDSLTVKLVSDTPIDLHAIDWNPTIAYTSARRQRRQPDDRTRAPITFDMTPEIEQYPNSLAAHRVGAVADRHRPPLATPT